MSVIIFQTVSAWRINHIINQMASAGVINVIWAIAILQAAAIAVSISIDAFAASFAYGCKKIKMPLSSLFIIALICTGMVGFSFFVGTLVMQSIPAGFTAGLAFSILLILGLIKLFDSITKSIIRKHTQFSKEINLSVFNFKLVMHLYADPESADLDSSKSISHKEAALLAISLSLDSLAVGLGAAMIGVNPWILALLTLATGFGALYFGGWLGNVAAAKIKFNISWIAGIILIGLAFLQLY